MLKGEREMALRGTDAAGVCPLLPREAAGGGGGKGKEPVLPGVEVNLRPQKKELHIHVCIDKMLATVINTK